MSASIISCVDASPVLEFAEHVLDLVPPTVERGVVRNPDLEVCLRGYAGADFAVGQGGAEPVGIVPVGIVALVAEQGLGLREGIEHQRRALVVTRPPFARQHGSGGVLSSQVTAILGPQNTL
tara:strand:- start:31444 stop:31809 length:366 start_codon:yes stop_codon:yes gene_type:complete